MKGGLGSSGNPVPSISRVVDSVTLGTNEGNGACKLGIGLGSVTGLAPSFSALRSGRWFGLPKTVGEAFILFIGHKIPDSPLGPPRILSRPKPQRNAAMQSQSASPLPRFGISMP